LEKKMTNTPNGVQTLNDFNSAFQYWFSIPAVLGDTFVALKSLTPIYVPIAGTPFALLGGLIAAPQEFGEALVAGMDNDPTTNVLVEAAGGVASVVVPTWGASVSGRFNA
jgi:hypothetical protein